MATVKAYKIGVNFVANATELKTPLAGVSKTLTGIENKQARVTRNFNSMRDAIQSTLVPAQKLADTMSVIANASMHLTNGAKTLRRVTMNMNQAAPPQASNLRGGLRGGAPNSYQSPGRVNLPVAAPVNPQLGYGGSSAGAASANNLSLNNGLGLILPAAPNYGPAAGGYAGSPRSRAHSAGSMAVGGMPNMMGLGGGRAVTPLSQAPRASFGRRSRFLAGRAVRGLGAYWQRNPPNIHTPNTMLHLLEGYEAFRFLRESIMLHGDIDQSLIMAAGPTDSDGNAQKQLRNLVYGLSASNKYISRSAAATLASEAFNTSGYNMDELKKLLPVYSDAYTAYASMGKGGSALEDTRKLINAFDIMGDAYNSKGEVDVGKLKSFVDAGLKMSLIDRYNFKPSTVRPFAAAAKTAGRLLSPRGFAELAPLIALNASGTGTAINSLELLMQGRKGPMYKKNIKALQSLGVLDSNGNLKDQTLLHNAPVEWIDKHYTSRPASEQSVFLGAMQRSTVQGLVTSVASFKGNIQKTVAALSSTDLAKTVDDLKHNTPQAAMSRLSTAWENLKDSIGKFGEGPGIKIMDKLADVIRKITKSMDNHPEKWQQMADNIGKLVMFVIRAASALGAIVDKLPVDKILKILGALTGASFGGKIGLAAGTLAAPFLGPETIPIGLGLGTGIGAGAGYLGTSLALAPTTPGGLQANGVPVGSPLSNTPIVLNNYMDGHLISQQVMQHQRDDLRNGNFDSASKFDPTQGRHIPGSKWDW